MKEQERRRGHQALKEMARQTMLEHGFRHEFSEKVQGHVETIQGPADGDGAIRDLTDLLWISIDNDDSLDLDQLTVAKELGGGQVELLIAIADVDALVVKDSHIDEHAGANTTSVYTPVGVFSMLPEKLSQGFTSLLPDGPRLAVVVEIVVDSDGHVQRSDVYRARVHNHAKLVYEDVAELLEGGRDTLVSREVEKQLRIQAEIARDLKELRVENGALGFETIESKVVVRPESAAEIREARRNRARELIEDFMIAANGITARFLEGRGFASIRRVVRSPERWDRIVILAAEYGERLPAAPDSNALEEFLVQMKHQDPVRFPDLSLSVIKLLGKGEYVVEAPGEDGSGHFGLAVRDYAHSTAPNRRYPDLVTQRLIKAALAGQKSPYSREELAQLAAHCTDREDQANKVERKLLKAAAALALSNRIGERFDGIVTGSSSKGTWVRILHPAIEGKLVQGDKGVDVGDRVRVKLIRTDPERGFIDFANLSPAGRGRLAKRGG